MNAHTCLALVSFLLFCIVSACCGENDAAQGSAAWQKRYQQAAEEYSLFRQPERAERLNLSPGPVYRWNHAVREGGTGGAIYVWTHQGCAEAVACFWCMRWADGHATIGHELHSLSPNVLSVERQGTDQWTPTAAFERTAFDEAPEPARKPSSRLAQMRTLASGFSGHAGTPETGRRELRLLPTPVYRYASTTRDVLDGALFLMACTVGTDPEAFLLIEARHTSDGPRWHYGIARFSHLDLFVSYDGREVWRAIRGESDTFAQNPTQTYRSFHVLVDESSD